MARTAAPGLLRWGCVARDRARRRGENQVARAPIQRRAVAPGKRSPTHTGGLGGQATQPAAPASGGGRPLPAPVQSEMQSLLGIDLDAIRIHEDGQAAEAGALAYTRGTDIHFAPGQYDPDSSKGRELIGHELAHVAQQARGGVAATTEVAGVPVNADPGLEGEADRIGARVARGESVAEPGASLQTPAAGAVAQLKEDLDGNPNDATDGSGTATTTHASPHLADAVNPPLAAGPAGSESRQTSVMVMASQSHPFLAPAGFQPAAALLYLESTASPPPAGFASITGFDGTVAAPLVDQEATRAIYIGGTPRPDDVDQGNLGDCFFLAAAMSMAQRDPGKLKSMIKSDGAGGATVSLWRAEEPPPATIVERILGSGPARTWTQVDVKVTDELAVKLSDGKVKGAVLRAAPDPTLSRHWADRVGSQLEVHREDLYDCARWAPLLEKAYARFTQTHGRYGGALKDNEANPASGYDGMGDGGQTRGALSVLYGPAIDGVDLKRRDTKWTGGSGLVAANAAVIDQLILLQGRDAPGAKQADAPILTASTGRSSIDRLATVISAAQSDPDWASIDDARQALVSAAATLALAWKALPPDPNPPASRPREDVEGVLGDTCAQAIRPEVGESSAEQKRLGRITAAVPAPISVAAGEGSFRPAGAAVDLGTLNRGLKRDRHPQVEVHIDGYASGDGVADPQALSERRADLVETSLISGGAVEPHTIATAGHGESAGGPRVEMSVTPLGQPQNPLLDPGRSQPIRDLADLLLNLRGYGREKAGPRNVVTEHVYSVVAVIIAMSNEVEVPLGAVPASVRHCLFPLVDPAVSTVTLRNPHHDNEPDRHDNDAAARAGDGAPDRDSADGKFRMSLRQFLLNFGAVTSGVLPKS